jgi:hypothetical protein
MNNYVTRDKTRRMSVEFDLHVDEAIEEAKTVMSREVTAIQMRNPGHVDKQNRLIADAHA